MWDENLKTIDYRLNEKQLDLPKVPVLDSGESIQGNSEFWEELYPETETLLTDDLKAELIAWSTDQSQPYELNWLIIVGVSLAILAGAGHYWWNHLRREHITDPDV